MNLLRLGAIALAAAGLLVGCGGSDDPPAAEKITYSKLVVFGDSLSDVGTYATPGLVAATGGGKYTVNAPGVLNWTERVATAAKVPALCPAQTGMNSVGPLAGFAAPVVNHPGCYSYAQGGARVTNPVGPGNVATLPESSGALGQLTVPLVTQMSNHLAAVGGSYAGTDLVAVMAGGNDQFRLITALKATIAAGGNATAAGQAATVAMGQAGGELAAYIKALVIAKGAKRVVVVGMPDSSLTPEALAADQATRDLVQMMAFTFNAQLLYGLQNVPEVLYVDLYTGIQRWNASPGTYGLTNVTTAACNPALAPYAVLCSTATTISGDVSKYLFADSSGHATPYGYELFAKLVVDALTAKGWL